MENSQDINPDDGVLRRYQLVQLRRHLRTAMLFSIASCVILSTVLSFIHPVSYVAIWAILIIAASLIGFKKAGDPFDDTELRNPVDKQTSLKILVVTVAYVCTVVHWWARKSAMPRATVAVASLTCTVSR